MQKLDVQNEGLGSEMEEGTNFSTSVSKIT